MLEPSCGDASASTNCQITRQLPSAPGNSVDVVSCSSGYDRAISQKICSEPTPEMLCGNDVQDNVESDVDCGGSVCTAIGQTCGDGRRCQQSTDCASGLCFASACVSCANGVMDGGETGTDCGGPQCSKCGDGSFAHEYRLYDFLVRVPLVVWQPGVVPAGAGGRPGWAGVRGSGVGRRAQHDP